mmetsp:Transcript_52278/g.162304  ORF Transcript_52278/g.162304 Transcript_52278/m.162304 type:complete len:250 (-) Transcript_52278:660-1409(-)
MSNIVRGMERKGRRSDRSSASSSFALLATPPCHSSPAVPLAPPALVLLPCSFRIPWKMFWLKERSTAIHGPYCLLLSPPCIPPAPLSSTPEQDAQVQSGGARPQLKQEVCQQALHQQHVSKGCERDFDPHDSHDLLRRIKGSGSLAPLLTFPSKSLRPNPNSKTFFMFIVRKAFALLCLLTATSSFFIVDTITRKASLYAAGRDFAPAPSSSSPAYPSGFCSPASCLFDEARLAVCGESGAPSAAQLPS